MFQESVKGLVSIGLPTYNRPELLGRALLFITAQTYTNLEVVVSDNASPDPRVKEIVEEFASRDARIKYFRQASNIGVLANADFVLKKSQGEYFAWFSDDDWRSPEFIEFLVEVLEKNQDANLAFCDYREVYEDGSRAKGYPSSHLQVFKPFESRSRLIRSVSYYWQDAMHGKPNIFYSVFRRSAVSALDLREITGQFSHLNMDCLLSFVLLQKSPVIIRSEVMCTLTCGNTKFYSNDKESDGGSNKSILKKLANFVVGHGEDASLYVKNASSLLEKGVICCLFIPKLTVLLARIATERFKRSGESRYGARESLESNRFPDVTKMEGGNNRNQKIQLPNVTLVAMATRNVEETLQALNYSCRGVEFGKVKLLSHYTPYDLDKTVEFVRIEKIKSIDDWSEKIIYSLSQYIETDFALLVHADGFVVNPASWKDEFLQYDYIGAPWPLPTDESSYRDINGNIVRVGNSVSLRSKRLLDLPIKLNMPWEPYCGFWNEDGFICVKNKHIYEAHDMKFAPLDVAKFFSHEVMIPEVHGIRPFVFHKWAGSNSVYPKF